MPHVALNGPAETLSTLDLIERRFTVLTTEDDSEWSHATAVLVSEYSTLHHMSVLGGNRVECDPGAWDAATGLKHGEALLIRPDGHVADHLDPARKTAALQAALQLAHRNGAT